jgi:DNA-directed RNA polymerase subunit P
MESGDSTGANENAGQALGAIFYECERCGTVQSLEELSKLPELTCINCGYRVLKKVRPPVAKRIDAV